MDGCHLSFMERFNATGEARGSMVSACSECPWALVFRKEARLSQSWLISIGRPGPVAEIRCILIKSVGSATCQFSGSVSVWGFATP